MFYIETRSGGEHSELLAKAEASANDDCGLWETNAHREFVAGLKVEDWTVQRWCAFGVGNMLAEGGTDVQQVVFAAWL